MTCKWQVENDKACNRVLIHHWPNVKRYGDIREVSGLEAVDVVTGGFPCQDLSVAGKRKGLAGKRSGLWFEFHRILAEIRPRWVVIENVPGLLSGCGCTTCQAIGRIIRIHSWLRERKGGVQCPICIAGKRLLKSHSGRNFTILLQGLAEIGYRSAWRVLDAQYYGVAQRRRRVFIVGSLGDGRAAEVLFEPESLSWDTAPCRQAGEGVTAPVKASSPSRRGGGSWPVAEEFVLPFDTTQITSPLNRNNPKFGDPSHPLSESARPPAIVQHALSGHNQRNDPDGEHFVVAFKEREGARAAARGQCGIPNALIRCGR